MGSKVEETMDSRLSSLPDDIIHKILSTVSMKDVVKTSVLSSRWRYIWTSMPYLNFSCKEFWLNRVTGELPKFTQFVKHVLSHRNNQVPVSSVKVNFYEDFNSGFIERIMKYILSHNVQQVDVKCLSRNIQLYRVKDDSDLLAILFSSQSLKRLSLSSEHAVFTKCLTASSTLELPALTTLYLSCVELYHDDDTLFSMCPNLKNLTLKSCKKKGLDSLSICHHLLSNLTLEDDMGCVKVVNVVAPQLVNLTIRYRFKEWDSDTDCFWKKHEISAPNLISLIYEGYDPLALSTDGFHSLEKVDLCICSISQEAAEALEIVRLFQQIQSVKFLTLNLEILELLSKSVKLISHQPSPFANIKRLKIYPKLVDNYKLPKEIANVSTEVKNYLLDNSPGATFTIVSREEILAEKKATLAKKGMAELQVLLEREEADIETNKAHTEQGNPPIESHNAKMDEEQNAQVKDQLQIEREHISSCWEGLSKQIEQGRGKTDDIVWRLHHIKKLLTELPASNRAELLPCFSRLCAATDIFIKQITDYMKIQLEDNQIRLNFGFHEFARALQSFS